MFVHRYVITASLIVSVVVGGCSDDTVPPVDTGSPDGALDTGSMEGGSPDTGAPDGPALDTAQVDKGPMIEQGVGQDKGPTMDKGPVKVDGAVGGCKSNTDCVVKGTFCNMPTGCKPPGTCKKIPAMCPSIYDPVCGCDNKDYSNSCMANSAGTSVKNKGKCGAGTTCDKLHTSYSAHMVQAKKCSPMLPAIQCNTLVSIQLKCPSCQTSVNKNTAAYASMMTLLAQFKAMGCDKQPWPCPKMPCKSVSTGKCSAKGVCVDQP